MSRRHRKQQSRSAAPGRQGIDRSRQSAGTSADEVPGATEWLALLTQNRAGLTGFLLSLGQLLLHASWLCLTVWLQNTGRAKEMSPESPIAWVVVTLLGAAMVMTVASLFVCLVYGLRRPPRGLALTGLAVSFFCGTLATAVVFMSALRAMSS